MKTSVNLHPLHLEDLRKSGLRDETISQAGISSVPPDEINRKTRYPHPDITSAYEIPYFNEQGSIKFSQYKIFPTVIDKDGRSVKYVHPKGTLPDPYIFPIVWSVKAKVNVPIWITEGVKKALKLIQHGAHTISISGVFNFRASEKGPEEDQYLWSDLNWFEWMGRSVYLAFDADLWNNPQVRYALWELALKLYGEGADVRFVVWATSNGKGIDDYLVNCEKNNEKAQDAIERLIKEAKLLDKFIQAGHEEAIIRAHTLARLSTIKSERIAKILAKKLNVNHTTIFHEINKRQAKEDDATVITDEEKESALELLRSQEPIDEYLKTCHSRYLGRDGLLILLKLVTISRKFKRGLSSFIKGTSSAGKSEMVMTVLMTMWPEDKEDFSRISENYLLYRTEPLEHKVITFFEMKGTEGAAHLIRSAITEGRLRLGTVLNDPKRGLSSADIDKPTDGIVIITTFASGNVDYELSTRVLECEVTHNENLAREVLKHKACASAYQCIPFKIWQVADKLIAPCDVVIPYAGRLAEGFPVSAERYMRDFDKVLTLIKSSALLHQFQREQDSESRIIACRKDYELVYRLRDLISESVSPASEALIKFLNAVQDLTDGEQCPTRAQVQATLNVSDATIKRYVRDAKGKDFIEVDGRGEKAVVKLIENPEPTSPLPSPEEIFSNPDEPVSQSPETADTQGFASAQGRMSQNEPMSQPSQKDDKAGSNGSTDQNGSSGGDPKETVDTQGFTQDSSTAHPNEGNNDLDEPPKNETKRFYYRNLKVVRDEV